MPLLAEKESHTDLAPVMCNGRRRKTSEIKGEMPINVGTLGKPERWYHV